MDSRRAFLIVSGGHGDRATIPPASVLESLMETLATWGYDSARTNALGPELTRAVASAGFRAVQDLTLLEASMANLGSRVTRTDSVRVTATPGSVALLSVRLGGSLSRTVVEVDRAAFPDDWALDPRSLRDALRATPRSRIFRTGDSTMTTGFLLAGIGNGTCYIQRLAVHPGHQRAGLGRSLMERGLEWASRLGATHSVVNTETGNIPALALYTSMGYRPMNHGLSVMERALP